jgi:hypothetical protein
MDDYKMIRLMGDGISISQNWKEKFKAIAETNPIVGGWAHEFEDKAKYKALPFWTKFSVWGLIFGIFFYLFKGMWKKALSVVGIIMVLSVLEEAFPNNKILAMGSYIIPGVIFFIQGNIDYYRKVVLGEDFWW